LVSNRIEVGGGDEVGHIAGEVGFSVGGERGDEEGEDARGERADIDIVKRVSPAYLRFLKNLRDSNDGKVTANPICRGDLSCDESRGSAGRYFSR
jgi:hypothetical protein